MRDSAAGIAAQLGAACTPFIARVRGRGAAGDRARPGAAADRSASGALLLGENAPPAQTTGWFTLSLQGRTSSLLPADASADAVRAAVAALDADGTWGFGGRVEVSDAVVAPAGALLAAGAPQRAWAVTFAGAYGSVPLLAADASLLVPAHGGIINVTRAVAGVTCEVQDVVLASSSPVAGTFACAYRGVSTPPLAANASADALAAALQALPTIAAPVAVTRRPAGAAGIVWRVAFEHGDATTTGDLPQLACTSVSLTSATRDARVATNAIANGAAARLGGLVTLSTAASGSGGALVTLQVNASAAELAAAVAQLGLLSTPLSQEADLNVTVTSRAGAPAEGVDWLIELPVASEDAPAIVVAASQLTGTGAAASAAVLQHGMLLARVRVALSAGSGTLAGTFRLAVQLRPAGGDDTASLLPDTTAALAASASAAAIELALEAMPGVDDVLVTDVASAPSNRTFDVTFVNISALAPAWVDGDAPTAIESWAITLQVLGTGTTLVTSSGALPFASVVQLQADELLTSAPTQQLVTGYLALSAPAASRDSTRPPRASLVRVPVNASADDMIAALEALAGVGHVSAAVKVVRVTPAARTVEWRVVVDDATAVNAVALAVDAAGVVCAVPGALVTAAVLAPPATTVPTGCTATSNATLTLAAPWRSNCTSAPLRYVDSARRVAAEVAAVLQVPAADVTVDSWPAAAFAASWRIQLPAYLGAMPLLQAVLSLSGAGTSPQCGAAAVAAVNVSRLQAGVAAEVQRVELAASSAIEASGTFTLVLNGARTQPLPATATAAEVAAALAALPTVGTGGVQVADAVPAVNRAGGRVWLVTFASNPGGVTLLRGFPGEHTLTANATSDAAVVATLLVPGAASGLAGTFQLSSPLGDASALLPWNARARQPSQPRSLRCRWWEP